MKALSLHQPWASLIVIGKKRIETRSWATKYRGPLAIHAAKVAVGINDGPWDDFTLDEYEATRGKVNALREGCQPLPLGAVVVICTLAACIPILRWDEDPSPRGDRFVAHVADNRHGQLWHWKGESPNWVSVPAWEVVNIEDQRPYGDFTPGRFAWLLEKVHVIDPIPATGHQGLWDWRGRDA